MKDYKSEFGAALTFRKPLLEKIDAEGTNAYRLFSGEREGIAGITLDVLAGVGILGWFEDRSEVPQSELAGLVHRAGPRLARLGA